MKYALTCLAGPTAMGLVALAPDTVSEARYYYGGGGADQGSASMRLAKPSPFGSRAGRRECLNLACTYEPTASALPFRIC